jgi:hypothetical protein
MLAKLLALATPIRMAKAKGGDLDSGLVSRAGEEVYRRIGGI